MSLEQLLLIAFIVVLPLIQYLVRLARQRNELPKQAEGPPPLAHRPPVPRTAHHTASGAMTAPARNPDLLVIPTAGRRARRGAPVVNLRNRFDLRRAVVLMTVIGPCRAASPHDWPDSAGGR
jgi:hypothetical protein